MLFREVLRFLPRRIQALGRKSFKVFQKFKDREPKLFTGLARLMRHLRDSLYCKDLQQDKNFSGSNRVGPYSLYITPTSLFFKHLLFHWLSFDDERPLAQSEL
jgi:hypothetical protein